MPLLPRSRRGTWLLAGAVWLPTFAAAWCILWPPVHTPTPRTVSVNELFQWLRDQPSDGPNRVSRPQLTLNEWVAVGRTIPDCESRLLAVFEGASSFMQTSIAIALSEFGSSRSVNPLIRVLKSGDARTQMECAAALGALGDATAVDALIGTAASSDINVRANAVMSLGKIGGKKAERCIIALMSDECDFVRKCAETALQILKEKSSAG